MDANPAHPGWAGELTAFGRSRKIPKAIVGGIDDQVAILEQSGRGGRPGSNGAGEPGERAIFGEAKLGALEHRLYRPRIGMPNRNSKRGP